MLKLNKEVLNWLLEEDNPPVKRRVLVNILKKSLKSQEVLAISKTINNYPPISKILDNHKLFWGKGCKYPLYQKYRGGAWQVIFLGDMGADSDDDRIRAGGEYILSTRNKRGLYFPSPGKERFILCLSANILRGLCKLGFDRDERVLEGLENVAGEIVKDGGVKCMVMDYSLLPDCFMTLPFILATLTTIPAEKRSGTVKEAMQIVTDRILEREVFVYVPANIEEWRKYSWDLTRSVAYGKKLATIKREKVRWLVEKGISGYVEKEGWKSFGFPLHYNPDILEALLALKSAEVVMGPQLEKALEAVEKKVSVDGKWKLNRTLNGKMVADVEVKGQASKWVTVRALEVLDYFGRMEH